ncbi:MAG: hypothetical protein AAFZ07_29795, partial [Actinomycetota bacterium]
DFDGDGDIDYAVTNLGLNTTYHVSEERPLRLYHGDLDGDGADDTVMAQRERLPNGELGERLVGRVDTITNRVGDEVTLGYADTNNRARVTAVTDTTTNQRSLSIAYPATDGVATVSKRVGGQTVATHHYWIGNVAGGGAHSARRMTYSDPGWSGSGGPGVHATRYQYHAESEYAAGDARIGLIASITEP